jgi:hypothetical protein
VEKSPLLALPDPTVKAFTNSIDVKFIIIPTGSFMREVQLISFHSTKLFAYNNPLNTYR